MNTDPYTPANRTIVLIVGGGIVGASAALFLFGANTDIQDAWDLTAELVSVLRAVAALAGATRRALGRALGAEAAVPART